MFPIVLDTKLFRIVVVGNGKVAEQRMALLKDAGYTPKHLKVAPKGGNPFKKAHIVFICDADEATAKRIYTLAKKAGAWVNAEDKKHYCDFHVPAIVRRGDLLLTVSTNGQSPRLSQRVKEVIAERFGKEWAARTKKIGKLRTRWRKQGIHYQELAKKTDEVLAEKGWL